MPSQSDSQRRAAALALSAKRGLRSPRTLTGSARQMFESMTVDELAEFSRKKKRGT